MATSTFAGRVGKAGKATRGRTAREVTPIAIRGAVDLPAGFVARIRRELAAKLGYAATLIERGTVRFEDVNGPKGGIDTVCRIKLVLSGRPSVQVEATAADPKVAFGRAVPALVRALERVRGKHGLRVGRRGTPSRTSTRGTAAGHAPRSSPRATRSSPRAARSSPRAPRSSPRAARSSPRAARAPRTAARRR